MIKKYIISDYREILPLIVMPFMAYALIVIMIVVVFVVINRN